MIVIWEGLALIHHDGLVSDGNWIAPVMWGGLLVGCLVAKLLTSSAAFTIAVTSHGIAVFHMRGFTWRSHRLVMRLPAAPPRMVRTGAGAHAEVDLGGTRFWVRANSFPLLRWMVGSPAGPGGRTRSRLSHPAVVQWSPTGTVVRPDRS